MNSTIRLFKAIPMGIRQIKNPQMDILNETIKYGFVFSMDVLSTYTTTELKSLIPIIKKELGLSGDELNSSFHKSWSKVKKANIEQLVAEQIIHYWTTYGMQRLGLFDENSFVYIPNEVFELPNVELDKIQLIVIKGYTKIELKGKLLGLLSTGIALKEETIQDALKVAHYVELINEDVDLIKNKEVKILLYDDLGLLPTNGVEFLRYVLYKSTGKSLLIKNTAIINAIKTSGESVFDLFAKYDKEIGLEELAKVFHRFKPIFLAFKTEKELAPIINRIRRLADKYHLPMPVDYLNDITRMIKNDETIDIYKLQTELSRVNIFRKIRLAYALKFRMQDTNSILYKIRNGKSYATTHEFDNRKEAKNILNIVLDSIVQDMGHMKGKKVYIPDNMVYALPATEKQFTGMLPSGTYVKIPSCIKSRFSSAKVRASTSAT